LKTEITVFINSLFQFRQPVATSINQIQMILPPALHAPASSFWSHMVPLLLRTYPVRCLGEMLTSAICPALHCLAYHQWFLNWLIVYMLKEPSSSVRYVAFAF